MKKAICYKCGKEKIAVKEAIDGEEVKVQMVKMTYGKNEGHYFCKDCKVEEDN